MSGQQVPFEVNRRALVRGSKGQWAEACGKVIGIKRWWVLFSGDIVVPDAAETAILPSQRPCCFDLDTHALDCARGKRIAANLASHIKRWLAPYVMPDPPPHGWADRVEVYQVYNHGLEQMIERADGVGWESMAGEPAEETALGWVCICDDGPTVEPWGLG